MRKFALVILDDLDRVVDIDGRYNLDVVTNPTGLGFNLNMSTLTGDIDDVITKVVQAKNKIKFTINQHQNSYTKANSLAFWLQKYSRAEYRMALEYDDGKLVRYCEGRVTSLGKTEQDVFKNLPQEFEFTQTTPFFVKRENTIVIQTSAVGKSYPFKYPFSYGRNEVRNNDIDNPYIFDIPLIVTLEDAIENPKIELYADGEATPYNTVQINDTLHDGEKLVINSAQKKIYKIFVNGTKQDYVQYTDPSLDTFLMAKNGHSVIGINLVGSNAKLTGGWREYRL